MKVVLVLDERTSLPFAVLEPQKEYTCKELQDIAFQWIRQYLKDNGYTYNRFYTIVTTQNQVKKTIKHIKII